MKKIFYLLFSIGLCFLFNISVVEGKNVTQVCYYKSSDSKLTFAVKAYDDGSSDAILMQPYSKADFGESQSYRTTWTNLESSIENSKCKQYMKYTIKTGIGGFNTFEFSNSKLSINSGSYLLTNYDFEKNASKCVYQGPDYKEKDSQFKYTVLIDKNSVFTYFDDDLNTIMDEKYKKDNTEYKSRDTYSRFMKYFYDDSPGCPIVDTIASAPGGGLVLPSVAFGPVEESNGGYNFGLIDSEYSDNLDIDKVVKSYQFNFTDSNVNIPFYIRVYESGDEKICIVPDNYAEKCYSNNNSGEIHLYSGVINGTRYNFLITTEQFVELFKYEKPGQFNTLIDPDPVYFNKTYMDNRYYISKQYEQGGVSSNDNGKNYQNQMCVLKSYFDNLEFDKSSYFLDFYVSAKETYSIDKIPCENWGYNYTFNCNDESCTNKLTYLIEQKMGDVRDYCVNIYNSFNKNNQNSINRMNECISFNNFYNQLVKNGVVNDLSEGCDMLSDDLKDKLIWILNIIKIAGPLLALGFGTLDFIKVLANGDADKEMKSAFKNFSIRLGAAALLFIVPLILAFLLDMFLSNQDGYNPDNPFCIEIDWDE